MRAMRAETFSGYQGLKLIELPKPAVTNGKVMVRITAAGVTPLDHTILSGKFHGSKAPLVLGNEGAGVVEKGGGTNFPVCDRWFRKFDELQPLITTKYFGSHCTHIISPLVQAFVPPSTVRFAPVM